MGSWFDDRAKSQARRDAAALPPQGLSRRRMLQRTAVVGGVAWAAPMVMTANASAQTTVSTCTSPNFLCGTGPTAKCCSTGTVNLCTSITVGNVVFNYCPNTLGGACPNNGKGTCAGGAASCNGGTPNICGGAGASCTGPSQCITNFCVGGVCTLTALG